MLSKLASQGVEKRFVFPRPMTDRPGLDFSFRPENVRREYHS